MVLGSALATDVQPASELMDRRVVLLLQRKDVGKGLAALAEMHGWDYAVIRKAERRVLRLSRRNVRRPRQASEVGPAIRDALPLDVARLLTTVPSRLEGQPVTIIPDPLPVAQRGLNGQARDWIYRRLAIQTEQARDEFQLSVKGRDFSSPTPFNNLTAAQQRLVVYSLFGAAAADSSEELLKALYGLPSYVLDPLNSRLVRKGDAYGIQGPNGGSFMLRTQGPFGR